MNRHDLRKLAPPAWLPKAWAGARQRGLETLTLDDINADIAEHRRPTAQRQDGDE